MNDIKRLFVAIDLPHEVQVEAHAACAFFEHKGLFKGKCTKAENLHLTLKFIGDVALDQVSIIQELLSKITMQPFMLTLGNLGAFKTDHIIKILYLDLESKYLQELARTIDYALEPVVTREQRPFVCHVTLARIKGVADKEQFFKEVERYHVERLQFKAMEFILMESELMPDGPIYKEVMRFPFME